MRSIEKVCMPESANGTTGVVRADDSAAELCLVQARMHHSLRIAPLFLRQPQRVRKEPKGLIDRDKKPTSLTVVAYHVYREDGDVHAGLDFSK